MIDSTVMDLNKLSSKSDRIEVYTIMSAVEQELVRCADGSEEIINILDESGFPVVRCLSELRFSIAPRVSVSRHSGGVVMCLGGVIEVQLSDSVSRLLAEALNDVL